VDAPTPAPGTTPEGAIEFDLLGPLQKIENASAFDFGAPQRPITRRLDLLA
jgi:hypothetical protein